MAVPQAKFREIVFQVLYSNVHGASWEKGVVDLIMGELKVTRKAVKQAQERVDAVLAKRGELDALIEKVSTAFAFDRIQAVEKTLLRLGVYELLFDDEIPPKVAITEAMRLARKFSTAEASGFINALLDTLYKQSLGEEGDASRLEEAVKALSESEELAEKLQKEQTTGEDQGTETS